MVANQSEAAGNTIARFAEAIGNDYVLTEEADREFYAMDVYSFREMPLAVLQPGSLDDLVAISRIASEAGIAMVPRGGGASYTDAYLPNTANSVHDRYLADEPRSGDQ